MSHDFLDNLGICLDLTHPCAKGMTKNVCADLRDQAWLSLFLLRAHSLLIMISNDDLGFIEDPRRRVHLTVCIQKDESGITVNSKGFPIRIVFLALLFQKCFFTS